MIRCLSVECFAPKTPASLLSLRIQVEELVCLEEMGLACIYYLLHSPLFRIFIGMLYLDQHKLTGLGDLKLRCAINEGLPQTLPRSDHLLFILLALAQHDKANLTRTDSTPSLTLSETCSLL